MFAFVTAVAVALVVSFMCSIFESVLLSINHAQVESLAARGNRAGRLLRRFKRRIDVPIAAILIVNTMAHTIGASVAGATYENVFDESTLWVFTIVFTVAVLLFTEIVPKTLGVTHARALAAPVAYGIYSLTVALRPLVAASERLSRFLRGGKEPPVTSAEEIRLLASLGRSEGVVGARTADIIVAATRLRQLRAIDVLLPREMVTFISGTSTRDEVIDLVRRSRHSRFPFSPTGDFDAISGVVLTKDLLFHVLEREHGDIDWKALVREPFVVPSSKPLNMLLYDFQSVRSHMALVFDEHGGFRGLVTMEDVLEEIIGEIDDEHDQAAREIVPQGEGTLHVRGTTELRKVCRYLGMEWPDNPDVVSVGGLVAERLGRVPNEGDAVEWRGLNLQVLAVKKRRADLIAIRSTGGEVRRASTE